MSGRVYIQGVLVDGGNRAVDFSEHHYPVMI